jgi:hypothetical protein
MPLADRIRDLGVGVAFPRINLDGLVPPAPAPSLPAVSLTVEEARKVLRATQMEAARTDSGVRRRRRAVRRLPAPLLRRRRLGREPLRRARSTSPDPSSCSEGPSSSGPTWYDSRPRLLIYILLHPDGHTSKNNDSTTVDSMQARQPNTVVMEKLTGYRNDIVSEKSMVQNNLNQGVAEKLTRDRNDIVPEKQVV